MNMMSESSEVQAAPAEDAVAEAVAAPAAPPAPPGPARAVGRRKSSTARCRIAPGEGKFTVNGRTVNDYFLDLRARQIALAPLEIVGGASKWNVIIVVSGGGTSGQAGAVSLALSRALLLGDTSLTGAIRGAGLMTRDARVKERKKYGRRGARRGFQFSKR